MHHSITASLARAADGSVPRGMVSMIGPVDHQSAQPRATVAAHYHPLQTIIDTSPTAYNHLRPAVGRIHFWNNSRKLVNADVLQMWWSVCPDAGCRVRLRSSGGYAPFCSQFVNCWRSKSGSGPQEDQVACMSIPNELLGLSFAPDYHWHRCNQVCDHGAG